MTSSTASGWMPIDFRPSAIGLTIVRPRLLRHRLVETGVHDERPVRPDDGPDEVRERLKDVVRVAEQKVLGRLPVVVRVAHREDLVNVVSHN